jgi:hypothetical protein
MTTARGRLPCDFLSEVHAVPAASDISAARYYFNTGALYAGG